MGKFIALAGLLLLAIGLLVWLGEAQSWFRLGRLPGDIHIRRGNFNFYFPLATCILISLLVTLILYLFRK